MRKFPGCSFLRDERISERLLEVAQAASKDSYLVLKTDAWNEIWDVPCKGGFQRNMPGKVICLELGLEAYEKAVAKGFSVMFGDIYNNPFGADIFDLVVDFCTINHGSGTCEAAIKGYRRVLKLGGMLLLAFWAKDSTIAYDADHRYYSEAEIGGFLRSHFENVDISPFFAKADEDLDLRLARCT